MTRGRRAVAAVGAVVALTAGLGPVVWGLANPAPTSNPLTGYDDERLVRHDGEETLAYITRANVVVAQQVQHSDDESPAQTWQVALLDRVTGGGFTGEMSYGEGVVHPSALRRGLCSQHAIVLAEVLRRNGVESADAYQMAGHVAVEFEHDGDTMLVDPDLDIAPFVVDWSDPTQLQAAATVAYADAPAPYDVEWATPIISDTAEDQGEYPRQRVEPIAHKQGALIELMSVSRLITVALGMLLVGAAIRQGRTRSR